MYLEVGRHRGDEVRHAQTGCSCTPLVAPAAAILYASNGGMRSKATEWTSGVQLAKEWDAIWTYEEPVGECLSRQARRRPYW